MRNATCYTCNQPLADDVHNDLLKDKEQTLTQQIEEQSEYKRERETLGELGKQPNTHYDKISDAYNHKTTLDT